MDFQNDSSYKKIGRFFKRLIIGGFILVFFILLLKFFSIVIAIALVMAVFYMMGWSLEQLYTSEGGLIIRNRIKAFFHDLIKGRKNENRKKQ